MNDIEKENLLGVYHVNLQIEDIQNALSFLGALMKA